MFRHLVVIHSFDVQCLSVVMMFVQGFPKKGGISEYKTVSRINIPAETFMSDFRKVRYVKMYIMSFFSSSITRI